jgi:hypothetical protein
VCICKSKSVKGRFYGMLFNGHNPRRVKDLNRLEVLIRENQKELLEKWYGKYWWHGNLFGVIGPMAGHGFGKMLFEANIYNELILLR